MIPETQEVPVGRHSMNDAPDVQADSVNPLAEGSIAPPGDPIDPGVPGSPDAPSGPTAPDTPSFPEPSPGSPEITPSEPPPYAPDESGDGSVPVPSWHSAGDQVL
jgi:hypothetical protein